MDVILQVHEAKRIFPVPEGLKELTSDIIREVLRHQPECIYSFIADYLETMLLVREKARDSAQVVTDIYRQGYFYEDLFRTKRVNRERAEAYASVIQACWRGYVVRKKLRQYLQKKKKLEEERERKKAMKIDQYLDSIGLTYEEATRAACIIQAGYRKSKQGKWIVNEFGEEIKVKAEDVPLGQRIREGDKAKGQYDRWEKEDWGDFFEMGEDGEIKYNWPRVGQLWKIPRKLVRPDMDMIRFFATKDLNGKEQYSYLKEPQKGRDPRGFPIGFLVPVLRETMDERFIEVCYVDPKLSVKMGEYAYTLSRTLEREDLITFIETLKERKAARELMENESSDESDLVTPRMMIQIRKDSLLDNDKEVMFVHEETAPETNGVYTFRAETLEMSLKVMTHILKSTCGTIEEAMMDAGNMTEYRDRTTGRFFPVETFDSPTYIQKVYIVPETKVAEYENADMDSFEYVFLPRRYKWRTPPPKPENPIQIPLTRFQGHKSHYKGSAALEKKVFIMGPMLHSPDGKPITHQSIFWDEFGPESWYTLLCKIATKKIARLDETEEEQLGEEEESGSEGYEVTTEPETAKEEHQAVEPSNAEEVAKEEEPVAAPTPAPPGAGEPAVPPQAPSSEEEHPTQTPAPASAPEPPMPPEEQPPEEEPPAQTDEASEEPAAEQTET